MHASVLALSIADRDSLHGLLCAITVTVLPKGVYENEVERLDSHIYPWTL